MVVCRAADGEIAFLENHAPYLGLLSIGPVRIYQGGSVVERAAVHGGFVEVSNDRVTILSDVAELGGDIDVNRARQAKDQAEQAARSDPDDEEAQAALRRAEVRLEVAAA